MEEVKRLRRTALYTPGHKPDLIQKVKRFKPDIVVLCVEDAVPLHEKDKARKEICWALQNVDFGGAERTVRVNSLYNIGEYKEDIGYRDIDEIIKYQPDAFVVTMVRSAKDVLAAEEVMRSAEKRYGLPRGKVKIIPLIECAWGVRNVEEIVEASPRVTALFYGAEDFTLDIDAPRTKTGEESFYARSKCVIVARTRGIDVLDTPWCDYADIEGLERETKLARQLRFDGKQAVSAKHIEIIHHIFTPLPEEIKHAEEVVETYERGLAGVDSIVMVGREMVCLPVASRAYKVLEKAKRLRVTEKESIERS